MLESAIDDLAPARVIRAAINTGNSVLAAIDGTGRLNGLSVSLAHALARSIGCPLELRHYTSAQAVVQAEVAGEWDLAFLAVDPQRSSRLHFSPPYLTIEATYAVRADSEFGKIEDVDRPGVRIASSQGAAYDLHLQRTLRHAERHTSATVSESVRRFLDGTCEVLAGIRPTLEDLVSARSEYRILSDSFLTIRHAMAIPVGRKAGSDLLDRFVQEAVEAGMIASLQQAGGGEPAAPAARKHDG